MRLPQPPILCITDRKQTTHPLREVAAQIYAAGCRWFSIREKDLPPDGIARLVASIRESAPEAVICVHADIAAFKIAGANGLHLPSTADATAARTELGREILLGQSVHWVAEAGAASGDLLDYLIAGPAFETPSKPGYGPSLGPAGLSRITAETALPVMAVGGITPRNAASCIQANCAGIAVMGAVMRASDPGRLFADIHDALQAE